jgi:prepilin-type N-terminal cleavage/methylation domain-containing protein
MNSARRAQRTRRAFEQGFTLVELLVAMVAGLLVITAAFLMSKGAMRLFGSESRLSSTQMNVRTAMDRLRGDLQRIAYQSTGNVVADPLMCQPTNLGRIQGVRLLHAASYTASASLTTVAGVSLGTLIKSSVFDANNLTPDAILVQGNFATTDLYPTSSFQNNGSTAVIWLSGTDPAVLRLVNSAGAGGAANAVAAAFPIGRLLRFTNGFGKSQYFVIQSTVVNTVGTVSTPLITIATPSTNAIVPPGATNCGFSGLGIGETVNSVQTYMYTVTSLASVSGGGSDAGTGAVYAWAYPYSGPSDLYKTDLVRTEIDVTQATDVPFAGTTPELVADNIVDLAFAISADISPPAQLNPTAEPYIGVYDFNDPNGYNLAADVTTGVSTSHPQRIRSIRVRLTGKNRDVDRNAAADDGGPDLLRVQVPLTTSGSGGTVGYARARTINEEVFLPNTRGLTW